MVDAAVPPKRPDPLVLLVAPPNRPPLLGALDVLLVLFAVPNRDGAAPPVEEVAPKRGLLGVLLLPLPLFWPNEKLMLADVRSGRWLGGCFVEGGVDAGNVIERAIELDVLRP